MVLYPGGTIIDSSTVGYLFFYNFLSNLGEWTAKNGDPNFNSAILFNISMIVLAVSYSVFYYSFLMIVIKKNKKIKLGICGEHGGDPKSIDFCARAGLDYVSCSPYRVPVARLAAAQATIKKIN